MRPRARVVDSARATNYHRAARSVFPTEVQHVRLNQSLVDAARDLLERRFPGEEGIAAAMYTEDGDMFTSVFFEPGGAAACFAPRPALSARRRNWASGSRPRCAFLDSPARTPC